MFRLTDANALMPPVTLEGVIVRVATWNGLTVSDADCVTPPLLPVIVTA